jgi:hypothetical protein
LENWCIIPIVITTTPNSNKGDSKMKKNFFTLDTHGLFEDDITFIDENGKECFYYVDFFGVSQKLYKHNPIIMFISLFYRGIFYFLLVDIG